jgi:hypothetical protein
MTCVAVLSLSCEVTKQLLKIRNHCLLTPVHRKWWCSSWHSCVVYKFEPWKALLNKVMKPQSNQTNIETKLHNKSPRHSN